MSPSRSWRCCINAPETLPLAGNELRKADPILAELVQTVQPSPHLRQPGLYGRRGSRLRRPFGRNRYAGRHAIDDIGLEPVAGGAPFRKRQRPEVAPVGDQSPHERTADLAPPPDSAAAPHAPLAAP